MPSFFRSTNDVPFSQDSSSRFVPWIMGAMMFLATLALAGAMLVSSVVKRWDSSYEDGLIVTIPKVVVDGFHFLDVDKEKQRQALNILRQIHGVGKAEIISKQNVSLLSEDILPADSKALMIEVKARAGYVIDADLVLSQLKKAIPEISIQSQKKWRQDTQLIAKSLIAISITIAILIGLAAVGTIAFVSHTGLKVHSKVIDVLHLIGARNDYIAKQFQVHAVSLGIKGAMIGSVMTGLGITLLHQFLIPISLPYLSDGLIWQDIVALMLFTPVAVLLLTATSARFTVLATLNKPSNNT